MKEFNTFCFETFTFDTSSLKACFYYSFDNEEFFEEEVDFNTSNIDLQWNKDDSEREIFLFQIHLALWMSYYKLFPTHELELKSWYLDDFQIEFWKKFYLYGLWEFFITNMLDPRDLLQFKNCLNKKQYKSGRSIEWSKENLLLLWGWKDSIVSYALIKETHFDTFIFGKWDIIKDRVSHLMGKKPLLVKRKISDNLFRLNELWYYNGHVPITWMIAFISIFYAYLYGYKNIILSNEKSSSEENIIWKWIKINHQYSKSFEFEKDFWEYVTKYLSQDIKYFSLLRWMYEYKIAKIFSKQTNFFQGFSSCNRNFTILWKKQDKSWCNSCPKCVFVFLILSNFLDIDNLEMIFWENLFDSVLLEDTFAELIWLKKHKPFECVWTVEESIFSFYKALKKYQNSNYVILERFKEDVVESFNRSEIKKIEDKLSKIYDEDIIPNEFREFLNK